MLDMLTHPSRGGHGSAKIFWAHGDSAAAKAMMSHHKLEPLREVLHLRAPVPASASIGDGDLSGDRGRLRRHGSRSTPGRSPTTTSGAS